MQIYITDSTKTTNQLTKNVSLVGEGGKAITAFLTEHITHTRHDTFYYYYVYADNATFQLLDVMANGSISDQLYVPTEVASDIREGRCKIILDHSLEGFPVTHFDAHNFQTFLGEFLDNTIYLSSDYLRGTSQFVSTQYSNYWELKISQLAGRNPDYTDAKMNPIAPAKFKAICKNRLTRPHRIEIVKRINDLNLQHDINYSFGIVPHHGTGLNFTLLGLTRVIKKTARIWKHDVEELSAWVIRHGEKHLFHENIDLSKNQASTISDELFNAHLDSYFEMIVETNYVEHTIFHSEKTFKAIAWSQPFVMFAERYSVQALRELGYDVFDDFIDHSYDNIADPIERMTATFLEVTRLCDISHDDWLKIYTQISDRLVSNRKHLFTCEERSTVLLNIKNNGESC
jgi:hypothetical protein